MISNKYLLPKNYARYLRQRLCGSNIIIDRLATPIEMSDLRKLAGVDISSLDLPEGKYRNWVKGMIPNWRRRFWHLRHKKLIEFYTTYTILAPQVDDVFLDAAGGVDTYVHRLPCRNRLLQDLKITPSLKTAVGPEIRYVESNAGEIPLPAESVDKIACHHSFEHFQGQADIDFIHEVQRLLKPGGRCCIVPIFIAEEYLEVTDDYTFELKFDPRSRQVIDPTATIPGKTHSGNYARIYDPAAFQTRVIDQIDRSIFRAAIHELLLDGSPIPDLSLHCHRTVTAINRPYRALVVERYS